jgi:cytochrome c oxidase subunit 2
VIRAIRPSRRSLVIRLALLVVLAVLLAGCAQTTSENPVPNFFPQVPVTQQGRLSVGLYDIVFWIAAAVFVLVEGLIFFAVFRYRRRRGDDGLPTQTHGNLAFELTWTAIPFLIVVVLFVMSLNVQDQVTAESSHPDLTVDVTGFQWQWTFDYKAQGLSFTGTGSEGPVMVLPVGQVVHIREHSNDVIHSFYVPAFFFKKDVVPGRTNTFDITIDTPGTYAGQCAEFCGLGHAQMRFTVRAVTPAEFDAWVTEEQAKAKATPAPAPSGQTVIKLSAKDIAFSTSTLTAPANQPFTISFTNDDAVPHNVAIFQGSDATGTNVFRGTVFAGPGKTMDYQVKALPAGTYYFHCDVHPTTMYGTLTVK